MSKFKSTTLEQPELISETDQCYHCGDKLPGHPVFNDNKSFCCQGCSAVFSLLAQNDLCDYYILDPLRQREKVTFDTNRYEYLDLPEIQSKLIRYQDLSRVHVMFHIPRIHCSSCIFLLEHMYRLHPGFLRTELNFPAKELTVVYDPGQLTLREVVEWLARLGYEPWLSLKDTDEKQSRRADKSILAKLGVAAFAFGNIMLLSFPEYLGSHLDDSTWLNDWFRYFAFALSVPVVFYSSSDFFISAWKSIKNGRLNIDAPVAIAIAVTFIRSTYEVFYLQAPGYFDSMTGIVFFMLIGRYVQGRTYRNLQYERDYRSYFPIAIQAYRSGNYQPVPLDALTKNDIVRILPEELIPADGMLVSEKAFLDYSFVTGESAIVSKNAGEMIYAGAKNSGDRIEVQLLQPVSQSYLTSLWNKDIFQQEKTHRDKWLDQVSQVFTWGVLIIAAATGTYWAFVDANMVMRTVTAVLIIACPCTLLLTASFTNGFVLGVFHRLGLYLKSASFLEILAKPDVVVLDKTGTITNSEESVMAYEGAVLTQDLERIIKTITGRSMHPLSRVIHRNYQHLEEEAVLESYQEYSGQGLEATSASYQIKLGSDVFVGVADSKHPGAHVHLSINGQHIGTYHIRQQYRLGIDHMLKRLNKLAKTWIISGDNDRERAKLATLTDHHTQMLFNQLPDDKLNLIAGIQKNNQKVIMVGDGLNDAGALRQSDLGIAVAASLNNFTPASDAILRADNLAVLDGFIKMSRKGRHIIAVCFGYSILYNVLGIYFAVKGLLTPLMAAIIMPASSLTIILFSWLLVRFFSQRIFNKRLIV